MRNKNIIFRKGDKGNTFVISGKEKYIEGVKRAISDYMINQIINVEKKFKQLFKDLLDNDKIS